MKPIMVGIEEKERQVLRRLLAHLKYGATRMPNVHEHAIDWACDQIRELLIGHVVLPGLCDEDE